jgi:hypothetical protein
MRKLKSPIGAKSTPQPPIWGAKRRVIQKTKVPHLGDLGGREADLGDLGVKKQGIKGQKIGSKVFIFNQL